VTISGIQTANLNSGEAVVANAATSAQGWTGLTQLNVNESSSGKASTITAAGPINVAVTDGALAGTTDTVQGGANVTVTATDTAAGSGITVGSITAPTGNVTINETTDGAGQAAGPIAVTGSATTTTTVSVTQVLAAATDMVGNITSTTPMLEAQPRPAASRRSSLTVWEEPRPRQHSSTAMP
jgi:hypothetical protein